MITKTENFQKFKIITLQNGLKFFLYPKSDVHSVSITAIINAGHLFEKKD